MREPESEHAGIVKVIEVLAESPDSWEHAAQRALEEAGSLRHVRSIYVKDMQAIVQDGRIALYRINAKISFAVESEAHSRTTERGERQSSSKGTRGERIMGRMEEGRRWFRDEDRGRYETQGEGRGYQDRDDYRSMGGRSSEQGRWQDRSQSFERGDETGRFQDRSRGSESDYYAREAWRPGEGRSQGGEYGNQGGQYGQYGQSGQYGQYGQSGPYGQYGQSGPYGYGGSDYGQRGQYSGGQYGRSQYGGGGMYGGGQSGQSGNYGGGQYGQSGNYGGGQYGQSGNYGQQSESYDRYSPYQSRGGQSEYDRYQSAQGGNYGSSYTQSRSEPDNWNRRVSQGGNETSWEGRMRGMGEQIEQFGGAMAGRMRRMFRAPKGYTRSDERIREDVCDQLAQSQQVDPSDIEVTVKEGEVTLSGQVPERAMKWTVEQVVDNVSGVKDIHNQLRVRRMDDNTSTTSSTTQSTATSPSSQTTRSNVSRGNS